MTDPDLSWLIELLAGFVAGFAAARFWYEKNREDRRKDLARSLMVEIDYIIDALRRFKKLEAGARNLAKVVGAGDTVTVVLSLPVSQDHFLVLPQVIGNLGLLGTERGAELIAFYHSIARLTTTHSAYDDAIRTRSSFEEQLAAQLHNELDKSLFKGSECLESLKAISV